MTEHTYTVARRGLELKFRRVRLAERSWQNGDYVRVRLHGADLAGFDSPGHDDHIRIFFPTGPAETVEQLRAAPSREYTPLAWGEDWLDVEFVIHGEPGQRGVAAEWAASAPIGAVVGVGGPRGSLIIEGRPDAWFLVGDETAVPAIRRITASLPQDAMGSVILEVADSAHHLAVDVPAGVAVHYVHRGFSPASAQLAARLDTLTAADRPTGDVFVFIAAEQSIVKPARAMALTRWRLDPERIVIKGYWKHGEPDTH